MDHGRFSSFKILNCIGFDASVVTIVICGGMNLPQTSCKSSFGGFLDRDAIAVYRDVDMRALTSLVQRVSSVAEYFLGELDAGLLEIS